MMISLERWTLILDLLVISRFGYITTLAEICRMLSRNLPTVSRRSRTPDALQTRDLAGIGGRRFRSEICLRMVLAVGHVVRATSVELQPDDVDVVGGGIVVGVVGERRGAREPVLIRGVFPGEVTRGGITSCRVVRVPG